MMGTVNCSRACLAFDMFFLISGFDEDTKQQGIPMEHTDHRAEQFIVDVPVSR